jgi:hypothetical protein
MRLKNVLCVILVLSLVTNCIGQAKPKNFEFVEISYGIYKSNNSTKDGAVSTPSIEHSVLEGISLVKKTEKITAALGTEFGVAYTLKSNLQDTILLEIEWIYPKEIIDPENNSKVKSIRYGIELPTNFVNNSNYTLEKHFEVVKGDWQLNIYLNRNLLYKRKFTLE